MRKRVFAHEYTYKYDRYDTINKSEVYINSFHDYSHSYDISILFDEETKEQGKIVDKTEQNAFRLLSNIARSPKVNKYHVDYFACVCENCGSEVYGIIKYPSYAVKSGFDYENDYDDEKLSNLIKTAENDFYEKVDAIDNPKMRIPEIQHCPICGETLHKDKGFFAVWFSGFEIYGKLTDVDNLYKITKQEIYHDPANDDDRISRIFDDLNIIRKTHENNEMLKIAEEYAKSCDTAVIAPNIDVNGIKNDPEKLKSFVLTLINLEVSIYEMPKLLGQLYHERRINDRRVVLSQYAESSRFAPSRACVRRHSPSASPSSKKFSKSRLRLTSSLPYPRSRQ